MDDRYHFGPPRRQGLIFHAGLALVIFAIGAWGIWRAFQSVFGLPFLLYLIPPIVAALLLPLIIYRAFALWRAYYTLERNGIHIHWGVRVEDIPMQNIIWVRKKGDPLLSKIGVIPLPLIRWPGAVRGMRRFTNGFPIEYMAADTTNLIYIATSQRIIAISPNQADTFLHTYQRLSELGALSPWSGRSIYPTFLLAKVWNAPLARYLILGAVLLDVVLFGWVSIVIPTRSEIFLGFTVSSEPVAAFRMLLLPFINTFFLAVNITLGVFYFRIEENPVDGSRSPDTKPVRRRQTTIPPRTLAYIIWCMGIVTPLLFFMAVFFITVTS